MDRPFRRPDRLVAARVITTLWTLSPLVMGCRPEFAEQPSQIDSARILAVRSDPPEAPPSTALKPSVVRYTALLVDEHGARRDVAIDWAYCSIPKSFDDLNDLNRACLQLSGEGIHPFGVGTEVSGTIPTNACREFGPDLPETRPGLPAGRPADPSPTGGYYQPVRLLFLTSETDFIAGMGETRVACGLPGATPDAIAEYARRYTLNTQPELSVTVTRPGQPEQRLVPSEDDTRPSLTVGRGERLVLRASWPECPDAAPCTGGGCQPPPACPGAERYAYYDLESRAVVDRRESMRVSWYATHELGGEFGSSSTGRGEADLATTSENSWTAPAVASTAHLWVVIRDSRGGSTWSGYTLSVQ